jgi:immunity protein, SdpI family
VVEHKRAWETVQIGLIVAMFVVAAVRWGSVPDQIPVHWNAAGDVDGYAGRFVGLLLLPIITAGLYFLLKFIPRIDPANRNYESFAGTYLLVRVLLTVYMAFIYVVTNLAIGREETVPVGELIIGAVGVLFIVLGGAMGKFRPNWFAGIRTPWTLSSKRSWVKTHRLGGRVFIAAGVAALLGAMIGGEWAFYAMFAVLIPGLVWVVVYSYIVWRDDPDKIGVQDVTPSGG